MPVKALIVASAAAVAIALPALAQQSVQPQPAPAPANQYPNGGIGAAAPQPAAAAPSAATPSRSSGPADDSAVQEVAAASLRPSAPPVEYPGWSRRDPAIVGSLDPADIGIGADAFGSSSGAFLSTLMRRMDVPLASRWAHIALRDALLARIQAPTQVNPVDWVAERAWLLLRMGEADAARMLIAGVDTDQATPKLVQVGVQTALATADAPALCPLEPGIRRYDKNIVQLVQAMCAALAGEPESASAQIDRARRYGRIGGIDLVLAEKLVGAAANTRSVTVEWEPVESLTAWRFGLASATGLLPPDRLINAASPQLRAFQARAPMLTAQQRLPSAFIAAGLGVFSSQTMVDLYSSIYDSTDPDALPSSDAWQLRQAYVAKDQATRLASVRRLLAFGKGPLGKEGARALAARAATLIVPDPALAADAPELISAMLAGGYDEAAARWIPAVNRMDSAQADRCWAMLALAGPNIAEIGSGRVASFIRRDKSPGQVRSALLVAGLAGLGRITQDSANSLNRRYGFGLGRTTRWTRIIDAAAARRQPGTVLVLTGTGFQTTSVDQLPASHVYHAIAALHLTGQDFTARMIAAEALSRT
ncbi:MAG: hypothetical protein ABIO80_08375 [Sphingomicrobium sp.]